MRNDLLLHLTTDTADLARGQACLRRFLEERGIGTRGVYNAELVFEEVVMNTIRHGYAGQASHRIRVSLSLAADDIVMVFEDEARQFDPLTVVEWQRPVLIDATKLGGNGLMLVRKATTSMAYERVLGKNVLKVGVARE